jgi:hypothetical protein
MDHSELLLNVSVLIFLHVDDFTMAVLLLALLFLEFVLFFGLVLFGLGLRVADWSEEPHRLLKDPREVS